MGRDDVRSWVKRDRIGGAASTLLLVFPIVALGCGDRVLDLAPAELAIAPPHFGDKRVLFVPKDEVEFIDFFVNHHLETFEMSAMLIERGNDAVVKEMAKRTARAQAEEVRVLRAVRRELTGTFEVPPLPGDGYMQRAKRKMISLSGQDLDRFFLQEIIPHHAAALPPAHRALATLKREDLWHLANKMFDQQAAEIGEMWTMLDRLGRPDPQEKQAGRPPTDDEQLIGDRRLPFTPSDDVAFIDFFVPHHEMAIYVATIESERGADETVRRMATAMKVRQSAEVISMKKARLELRGMPDASPIPLDPHLEADVAALLDASGLTVDRLFLEIMILHHAGGLPTAHRAVPNLARSDMRELALGMFADQADEIGQMHRILTELRDAPTASSP